MKHVGQAVKNRGNMGGKSVPSNINVIGIAAWGVIGASESLVSRHGQGCYPAYYDAKEGIGMLVLFVVRSFIFIAYYVNCSNRIDF